MPHGDHVLGAVGGEVGLEPDRPGLSPSRAATGHELAFAVEVDDVPVAAGDVVAVVALAARIGRIGAVVAEVAGQAVVDRQFPNRGCPAPVVSAP